jgi:hypothetical protein
MMINNYMISNCYIIYLSLLFNIIIDTPYSQQYTVPTNAPFSFPPSPIFLQAPINLNKVNRHHPSNSPIPPLKQFELVLQEVTRRIQSLSQHRQTLQNRGNHYYR